MGLNTLKKNIEKLIEYWRNQGIQIETNSMYQIDLLEEEKKFRLPNDFREFYQAVNGMTSIYPNDMDEAGFLFYPFEELTSFQNEFNKKSVGSERRNILIFAEYMHKSWWYGVRLTDVTDEYEIGIIPDEDRFKPITKSLSDFIELYLEDSPALYDYEN